MKVLVNFSTPKFRINQVFNSLTGIFYGRFNKVKAYTEKDIDKEFYRKNFEILNEKRGGGYWLWKPYFILKTLKDLKPGDFLFYCDSACFFVNKIDFLISSLLESNQDVMVYCLPLLESQWTKPSIKEHLYYLDESFFETNQRLASFILFQKTDHSISFVEEWLELCKDPILLTDINVEKDRKRNLSFIDHRHDQSLFSLLSKKYGYSPFRDPSQFGENIQLFVGEKRYIRAPLISKSLYPRILIQYRKIPFGKAFFKAILKYY
ncbi:MAG TPA: hypothetical protein PLP03_04050 [Bacteroidales bacterium]|nr:hypothetical protein [Bacteroidales bacterium]